MQLVEKFKSKLIFFFIKTIFENKEQDFCILYCVHGIIFPVPKTKLKKLFKVLGQIFHQFVCGIYKSGSLP